MGILTEKTKQKQATTSPIFSSEQRSHAGNFQDPNSIHNLQPTIGNQEEQKYHQSNTEDINAQLTGAISSNLRDDFSRIPVAPTTVGQLQTKQKYMKETSVGQRLIASELVHDIQNNHSDVALIQRQEGPQSYAGASQGYELVDPTIMDRNRVIEQDLLDSAESLYLSGDLRWFFTYAHGRITQQIIRNISAFQRPNALLRLNIHFAEAFIRSLDGQPHEHWKRAFRLCQAAEISSYIAPAVDIVKTESCGAAMAHVHINVDLTAALREVGCIPPSDYSNVLPFVNRASFDALVRLRGQTLGAAEAMLQHLVAPLVGLEVKAWRNAAFESACNVPVPEVDPAAGKTD
jgi:hypothetical protein